MYSLDNTQPNSTLTNDSYISAMVTVELPHTTCTAALCHTVFSSSTGDASKNWPTSLTKVSCNCPYKKTRRFVVHLYKESQSSQRF